MSKVGPLVVVIRVALQNFVHVQSNTPSDIQSSRRLAMTVARFRYIAVAVGIALMSVVIEQLGQDTETGMFVASFQASAPASEHVIEGAT